MPSYKCTNGWELNSQLSSYESSTIKPPLYKCGILIWLYLVKLIDSYVQDSNAGCTVCIFCLRYSRETPFTALNVDVRNHHNLIDSLEHYVKGDLLEGANAYYCERCDKKVDTVKRMCVKKLPNVLAIQLKRFEYDWER